MILNTISYIFKIPFTVHVLVHVHERYKIIWWQKNKIHMQM